VSKAILKSIFGVQALKKKVKLGKPQRMLLGEKPRKTGTNDES
jgi:hypothetical protein